MSTPTNVNPEAAAVASSGAINAGLEFLVDPDTGQPYDASHPVPVTGTFTPSGGNQRVNAQAGDFVAGSLVDLATLLTLSGTPTDANTINSLMGRLTKIRDLLNAFGLDNTDRQKVSVYGKNAAAGDTTLLVDSGGRLNVIQTIGGSAISVTNPEPNISNIQQFILNGQGFSATTGKVTAAANMAAQFWVPSSSTKNVLIWSVRMAYSNANQSGQLTLLSAQDANITGAGVVSDAANFTNLKAGGSAAASGATLQHNGGIATTSGTPLDFFGTPLSQGVELLSSGMFILIPSGTAAGLGIYEATTAAGQWAATVRWVEY